MPWQIEELIRIRERSAFLIAIGACATAGGIQALRNTADASEFARYVYPNPEYINALEHSTPLSDHVKVDLELVGCPVDRGQLLGALASVLRGAVPRLSHAPVCVECKRRGYVCVVVAKGEPCMGPVTSTGCGALCPAFGRGCYGCFGPAAGLRPEAMRALLAAQGLTDEEIEARFRLINSWAPGFREAAEVSR
jgi:coenzyme F420-reducing hydrogenase gamma subunit